MLFARETVPAPFIVAPAGWDGEDGNWTSFALEVGTPPQSFRVFPATIGQEIWVPSWDGCEYQLSGLSDCGALRGVGNYSNAPSRGFTWRNSSSFDKLDLFALSTEQNLFPGDNGNFGLDTVSISHTTTNNFDDRIQNQTIAAIETADFWLGRLGLSPVLGHFPGQSNVPSLLASMKTQKLIPSLSYGYTAGQSYASPRVNGSLVLGGYDQARISSETMTFLVDNSTLQVSLQVPLLSITLSPALTGSIVRPVTNSINVTIDSAVSHLWLPLNVCQTFESAFGLSYDNSTGLYLVNDTIHSQLLSTNPSITFTLGNEDASVKIAMNYTSFDMGVGIPWYNNITPYFPLRRAANESQYVLGRTFLQEAYLAVDWERGNFTVGQALPPTSQNILAILPPSTSSSSNSSITAPAAAGTSAAPGSSSGIGAGGIAGIVLAIVVALVIALAGFIILRRRKRKGQAAELEANSVLPPNYFPPEKEGEKSRDINVLDAPIFEMQDTSVMPTPSELGSTPRYEMDQGTINSELQGTPVMEMAGSEVGSELDVSTIGSPASSRPTSPRRRPSYLRHSRYLSIDGSTSGRLAELSSESGSDLDVSSIGSRPQSLGRSPNRFRYVSMDGSTPGIVLEERENVPPIPMSPEIVPVAAPDDAATNEEDTGNRVSRIVSHELTDVEVPKEEIDEQRRPD